MDTVYLTLKLEYLGNYDNSACIEQVLLPLGMCSRQEPRTFSNMAADPVLERSKNRTRNYIKSSAGSLIKGRNKLSGRVTDNDVYQTLLLPPSEVN